jgi:hypothetical protein
MTMSEPTPEVTYYDKEGNEIAVQTPQEAQTPIELISQSVVIVDQRFVDCPEAVATIQV